jgi:hypothetical protein
MSHVVTGTVQIKRSEIDALRRAVEHFGATLDARDTFRSYEGNQSCEQVIGKGLSGSYEIGLRRKANSEVYELAYDSWGPGGWITQTFGPKLEKLHDRFLAEVATDEFTSQGMTSTIEETPEGLVIEGVTYATE